MEAGTENLVDTLARLSLFADLNRPQLETLALSSTEEVYVEGQRVLRQGMTGGGFYVILEGEASVMIDGQERARLRLGDFFGEISILTGEAPTADAGSRRRTAWRGRGSRGARSSRAMRRPAACSGASRSTSA